jgi:hypothetical protein
MQFKSASLISAHVSFISSRSSRRNIAFSESSTAGTSFAACSRCSSSASSAFLSVMKFSAHTSGSASARATMILIIASAFSPE